MPHDSVIKLIPQEHLPGSYFVLYWVNAPIVLVKRSTEPWMVFYRSSGSISISEQTNHEIQSFFFDCDATMLGTRLQVKGMLMLGDLSPSAKDRKREGKENTLEKSRRKIQMELYFEDVKSSFSSNIKFPE